MRLFAASPGWLKFIVAGLVLATFYNFAVFKGVDFSPLNMRPATAAAAPAPTTASGVSCGDEMAATLATIRQKESTDNYARVNTDPNATGRAAGAYQVLTDTWARYGGYATADAAPAEVQDRFAREHVEQARDGGKPLEAVPVTWYIGHYPPQPPRWDWDRVPAPGNKLTPRQYLAEWMDVYRTKLVPCPTVASPLPAGTYQGAPAPHHDYPAVDLGSARGVVIGTPVYAVYAGTVRYVDDTCGTGVAVVGADAWLYCHGTDRTVAEGTEVPAGAQIMTSGWSGAVQCRCPADAHLHIEKRQGGLQGPNVCPWAPVEPLDRISATSCTGGSL